MICAQLVFETLKLRGQPAMWSKDFNNTLE
jgi:hypothetical protein